MRSEYRELHAVIAFEDVESKLETSGTFAQENFSYQQEHVPATSLAIVKRDI